MKCIHCRGLMTRGVAPYSADRNGYHIRWDAIPAWVCSQCSESYFEEQEVALIQASLTALDEKAGLLQRTAA